MKKKIFALILMTALMSVFVGCAVEDEKKPIALSERVGTYTGTIPAGSGGGNVTVTLSATTGGAGTIHLNVSGNSAGMDGSDDLAQNAKEMATTGTTFKFMFTNPVDVVFDSETEATGAKATFTVAPNTITVVLTKK